MTKEKQGSHKKAVCLIQDRVDSKFRLYVLVECHLGPIQKNSNIFENGLIFLHKSTFRLPETSESAHQNRYVEWVYMVATGQEMKIKLLQG